MSRCFISGMFPYSSDADSFEDVSLSLSLFPPGKAVKSSLQQKGSKRSVRRMKFLDIYCDELLKCDQSVTQSSQVTQFFTPKDHDVQTDYTKNR